KPEFDPSSSPSKYSISLDFLRQHLAGKDHRQVDEETRRPIITLAGDASVKRGYVFFSEVQFIPAEGLWKIDALWRQHSNGKFGYNVQRRIWKKLNGDFTAFFIKVGWMKKLESSEVEQYNYRSFPVEFMWEMEEGPPEGNLPLTNALRGTQLLSWILSHPAFDGDR
ncbi:tetrapyrrole-binding protein, chloroplastic-like, partial [Salvia splendens]|uniref:tetrapyrrole-binding protein, chloroplastic-like n=1 Tax=Salvia splendens TaxID=180675 RepID=UPI001C25DE05